MKIHKINILQFSYLAENGGDIRQQFCNFMR